MVACCRLTNSIKSWFCFNSCSIVLEFAVIVFAVIVFAVIVSGVDVSATLHLCEYLYIFPQSEHTHPSTVLLHKCVMINSKIYNSKY
jgi:hypothetical protein